MVERSFVPGSFGVISIAIVWSLAEERREAVEQYKKVSLLVIGFSLISMPNTYENRLCDNLSADAARLPEFLRSPSYRMG